MPKQINYYDFRIDSLTPETLRLNRFVDYVDALRSLLGSPDDLYFSKVLKGSAVLQIGAKGAAVKKIGDRLRLVGGTDAPSDLAESNRKLNDLLRKDNASAKLSLKGGALIIKFPGARTPLAQEAIVHEVGTLDGTIVGVKGVDDSVQVWIKTAEDELHKCRAKRELARQLAPLWDCYVRLAGKGKWKRGGDRRWTLEEFEIQSFEQLDDTSLVQVVDSIRQIAGNGWNDMEDAQAHWRELRAE